ncbi:MAG: glycosyltransferase [Clostridia bacterium]|nr:glycosyltransferase [Clostridia bacterium]
MISVIIPVFNVEKYLPRCIESVIGQEYRDLEIILVDDGSTDDSGNICDQYAVNDKRIKVIHKKNGGLPDARNAGIKASSGEFIGLVDSDDYISPKMYSRLFDVLVSTNADIAECRFIKTEKEDLFLDDPETVPKKFNTEEALKELINDCVLTQTTVNKLYRRNIMLSIPFIKGIYNEDEFWTYRVFAECDSLAFIDERLYYYYQRRGSIINSDYNIRRLDGLKALYERIGFMEQRFPSLVPAARSSYLGNCFYAYQRLCSSNIEKQEKEAHKAEIFRNFCTESKKPKIKKKKFKQKIWYFMFRIMPDTTCYIRNKLKIGL